MTHNRYLAACFAIVALFATASLTACSDPIEDTGDAIEDVGDAID